MLVSVAPETVALAMETSPFLLYVGTSVTAERSRHQSYSATELVAQMRGLAAA